MPINVLYHTWIQRIRELRPVQRIMQIRGFVWLIGGIFQSRSVNLSRIAGKVFGKTKLVMVTRRLSRLFANPVIAVCEWDERALAYYDPASKGWVAGPGLFEACVGSSSRYT